MSVVGTVSGLWRFPVKSMAGEQLEAAPITGVGVLGDRAYALIETDTGRVVSAKSVRVFPDILDCGAAFVEPPQRGAELPPVSISLPDGTVVRSDAAGADAALSAYFGRDVALRRSAPDDFTIDAYDPDVDAVVPVQLGTALFAKLEMESPVPAGSFFDVFPITVLTSATLAQLSHRQPQSRFDVRRFRMNVIVEARADGFVENDWIGRTLRVGETARLSIAMNDPRCVMVTLAQADLHQDTDILKTLVRENMRQVGSLGVLPCAGVYAVIDTPGTICVGDDVALT